MPRSTIEIRKNVASHYYFVLFVPRRDSLLTSPAYKTRENAMNAVSALRSAVRFNNRYQRLISPRMEPYFSVWSHDGHVVGTSIMFAATVECEQAIRATKRWAPNANLIEAVAVTAGAQ